MDADEKIQAELDNIKGAAKVIGKKTMQIGRSAFRILKIFKAEALTAIEDFVESIHQGSTIVLIKDENFAKARDALDALNDLETQSYEILPEIDYKTALDNFNRISSESKVLHQTALMKAEVIEAFNFNAWKEEVANILDGNKTNAVTDKLKTKVEEFYQLIFSVAGVPLTWSREDSDTVFSQDKSGRRHIVNLAFKVVLPLVKQQVEALRLGNEREANLLRLLEEILFLRDRALLR